VGTDREGLMDDWINGLLRETEGDGSGGFMDWWIIGLGGVNEGVGVWGFIEFVVELVGLGLWRKKSVLNRDQSCSSVLRS
jgi:hypothetical protein